MKLRAGISILLVILVAALLAPSSGATAPATRLPELPDGRWLDMIDVPLPERGMGLQVHFDFPEENPLVVGDRRFYAVTANVFPNGDVNVVNAIGSNEADGPGRGPACEDPFFDRVGLRWPTRKLPVLWRVNLGSLPKYMSRQATLRRLKGAHRAWPLTVTNCRPAQKNGFAFRFDGLTKRRIGYNHQNQVKWADIRENALAINYTWFADRRIVEVDLRFNRNYLWANTPRLEGRYQVKAVAVHELGHQLGLEDLGDPHRALTMYGRTGRGQTRQATLGRGDIRGARELYSP